MLKPIKLYVLFLVFTLSVLQLICEAKSEYSDKLYKIEKSLFNTTYDEQSDEIRLGRIEKNVYGITSNVPINLRINKLSKDLSTDLLGQEIKPLRDSFLYDDEIITDKSKIDVLEKKLLSKSFSDDKNSTRLVRLEKKLFQTEFSDDNYETRINRIEGADVAQNSIKKYNKNKVIQNITTAAELGTIIFMVLPFFL